MIFWILLSRQQPLQAEVVDSEDYSDRGEKLSGSSNFSSYRTSTPVKPPTVKAHILS